MSGASTALIGLSEGVGVRQAQELYPRLWNAVVSPPRYRRRLDVTHLRYGGNSTESINDFGCRNRWIHGQC